MLFIENATTGSPERQVHQVDVLIEAGRMTDIAQTGRLDRPPTAQVINAAGLMLAPGFIDLQLNGAFGHDFTANPETIWPVAEKLPRFGVTSFLPTIITSPPDTIRTAQRVLRDGRPANFQGAEPLGLHLEGPFLNPEKKGAHNPAYLQVPDPGLITGWSPAQGVRLVTLAPELPGGLALVEQLTGRGVVVSAGHSLASFEEAQAGFKAGIAYGTHLFNAMPFMRHREPGLAGALLDDPGCVAGLIPDGVHVHPAMVRLAWAAKGRTGRLNLVSDAMAALGMSPGRYQLNDFEVFVTETTARLADGTLAGSILPLDAAVRNIIAMTGCSLGDALASVTTTPASILGLADRRGRLEPGAAADFVLLSPDLEIVLTITAGKISYQKEDRRC